MATEWPPFSITIVLAGFGATDKKLIAFCNAHHNLLGIGIRQLISNGSRFCGEFSPAFYTVDFCLHVATPRTALLLNASGHTSFPLPRSIIDLTTGCIRELNLASAPVGAGSLGALRSLLAVQLPQELRLWRPIKKLTRCVVPTAFEFSACGRGALVRLDSTARSAALLEQRIAQTARHGDDPAPEAGILRVWVDRRAHLRGVNHVSDQ